MLPTPSPEILHEVSSKRPRRRVLFLCHYRPYPANTGTLLRNYHLAVGLAQRHSLTLVVPPHDPADDPTPLDQWPIRKICENVVEAPVKPSYGTAIWGSLSKRVYRLIRRREPYYLKNWDIYQYINFLRDRFPVKNYDVVWACRMPLGEAARLAGYRRVVVDSDMLPSSEFERQIAQYSSHRTWPLLKLELKKLYQYESKMIDRFDHIAFCNPDDAKKVLGDQTKVSVVPNGYVFPATTPHTESIVQGNITFVGLLNYNSNVDAVHYFVNEILPLIKVKYPKAVFHIVGRSPSESVSQLHNGDDCIVHGTVPEVAPYLERASIVVAPNRMGAGTRLKVIEGHAYGKAIIGTRTAFEGLDLRHGIDAAIVDDHDPRAFADWCIRLLSDSNLRCQMGQSGRLRAIERYDWTRIIPAAEKALLGDV